MTKQMSAHVYRWSDMPSDSPMELLERRRIMGERAMLSHVTLQAGFSVPSHAHENEQFAVVLSGRMRFEIGGDAVKVVEVGSGEALHLPSMVPHAAEALETSVVLDVFSPPSEQTGIDQKSA